MLATDPSLGLARVGEGRDHRGFAQRGQPPHHSGEGRIGVHQVDSHRRDEPPQLEGSPHQITVTGQPQLVHGHLHLAELACQVGGLPQARHAQIEAAPGDAPVQGDQRPLGPAPTQGVRHAQDANAPHGRRFGPRSPGGTGFRGMVGVSVGGSRSLDPPRWGKGRWDAKSAP